MESIWSKTAKIEPRPALKGDMQTDVAIIGGGMAGLLTAFLLQRRGIDCIVLEKETVGSGQTKNTTAKITSQHGLIYSKLIKTLGAEKARLYAQANEKAIQLYREFVEEYHIDCAFETKRAYLYSTLNAQPLIEETQAAALLGINARFVTDAPLPFAIQGAEMFPGQAQFHPLVFLRAVAQQVRVFEHTQVRHVYDNRVETDNGVVTAKKIIFCTHYPFINFPGCYFLKMHQERSYVLALENAGQVEGMYIACDGDGLSLRNEGDILLLGGGNHRTGENSAGERYETLNRFAKQFYPECRVYTKWSAQDCMPLDSVPYIGRYAAGKPNWYVATGFQKWGMTTSMVAAMILTDMVRGIPSPYEALYTPQRFHLKASYQNMVTDGLMSLRSLSKELLHIPKDSLDAIAPGHGGIVRFNGKKAGAYKDQNGQIFLVDTRCPHLGCMLEWNPDELTWDCPCHGSRFTYRGELLDNPAERELPLIQC